jgi:hypothetical protein
MRQHRPQQRVVRRRASYSTKNDPNPIAAPTARKDLVRDGGAFLLVLADLARRQDGRRPS